MRVRGLLLLAAALIAAAAVYLVMGRDAPQPGAQRPVIWSVDAETLEMIAIGLPHSGRRETWFLGEDRRWRFDRPDGPRVDPRRWGDGIALLLDAPVAERLISADADPDQRAVFGLAEPRMEIELGIRGREPIRVSVGAATPDGQAYYLVLAGRGAVYSIDRSWYRVLERLVLEPPHLNGPS